MNKTNITQVLELASGRKLDIFFERSSRSWVVALKTAEGNQIGDADYIASKREAVVLALYYIKQEGGEAKRTRAPGAGRPSEGREMVSIRLSAKARRNIKAIMKRSGIPTATGAIEAALEIVAGRKLDPAEADRPNR